MRKPYIYDIILMIVILLQLNFLACGTPIQKASTTIATIDKLILASDKGTAAWYTESANKCLNQAIGERDKLVIELKDEGKAKTTAKNSYTECMKIPNDIAKKIADIVDLLYKENKFSAQVALDIIKKREKSELIGNISHKAIDLILDLRKILKDNNINIGE